GIGYFHVTGVQTCALPISLQLRGTDTNGAINDFGQSTFASTLVSGEMLSASLTGSGSYDPGSSSFPQFYGPTGQEIGAVFSLRRSEERRVGKERRRAWKPQ